LIRNIGIGIYLIQNGKFIYVNPFFESVTGYSIKDLLDHNSLDFVHPDDRERVRVIAVENLKTGQSQLPYEYRFIKKNGETLWALERITSIDYAGERASMVSFMDITSRKQLEEALKQSEERFRLILEDIQDNYSEVDLHGSFIFTNNAIVRSLGYSRDELSGMNYRHYTPAEDVERVFHAFNEVYRTGEPNRGYTHRMIKKNGNIGYAETSITPIRDGTGNITGFRCVGRDVTERVMLENALELSEERYRTIIDEIRDSYFEVDLAGDFTFVNNATCIDMGYTRHELLGLNYRVVTAEDEQQGIFSVFNKVFTTGEPHRGFAFKVVRKDGTIRYAETSVSLLKDNTGKATGFRCVGRDATERKLLEHKLSDMAMHDPLTGLANRLLLSDRFQVGQANAQRRGLKMALMSLDLDRFKTVNDTLGHVVGDLLLKGVASRLIGSVRSGDTVARIGGDEFVVLFCDVSSDDDIVIIAGKLVETFNKPLSCEGHKLDITASIGISVYPDDGNTLETLLKNADTAMYEAKQSGRNRFRLHREFRDK
jgi:diguanylate cyclase (GGDEF)-like protein/PAS domain S-box-containing protein